MPMPIENQTLRQLQEYISRIEVERGFSKQSAIEKCLLLGEEVGELFKAVRRSAGMAMDPSSLHREVSEELADVLIFLIAIANRFEIDLDAAFREKEKTNSDRRWT